MMIGKLRIQLKQSWFWRIYPIWVDGRLEGTLYGKNREIQLQLGHGTHEIQVQYQGKWVTLPVDVTPEAHIIHLHIKDQGWGLDQSTAASQVAQWGFFVFSFFLFLWGYWQYAWNGKLAIPLSFWFLLQIMQRNAKESPLKIERFNPSRH